MKNHLRSSVAALGFGLFTAGVFAPAFAQPQSVPRQFNSQQVHYIRVSLSPSMCASTGSNTCRFKVPASVPYNTIINRVSVAIGTAFNSVTTDVLYLGTTNSTQDIVSLGCSIHTAGIIACTIAAAGLGGINPLGNGATQTGLNGGFDLWIAWQTTGGAPAATTGVGTMIIEYIAPNDGQCSPTALGATASGC